jgi:hypothetical protein
MSQAYGEEMVASCGVLVDRARTQAGLTDLGTGMWRLGLERLLEAVAHEVHDAAAVVRIEHLLTQRLVQRLRVQDWYAQYAALAKTAVEGPLIICGLPRTATTALHHLLAVDQQFRYLRSWEVNDPVPPPVADREHEDPRRPTKRPGEDVRHIVAVDGPSEDWPIHALAFDHAELTLPVPSYSRWWRTREHVDLFDFHDRFLRLLQSHRPPHRWLLKMPAYIFLIEDVAAHYPDACFAMTHRDPVTVMASTCSVVAESRRKRVPMWVPEPSFGHMLLEHWACGMECAMSARDALGDDRFVDVAQHELETDPVGTAARVYGLVGLRLSGDVADAMVQWGERNRRGSRGAHAYSLDEFGLRASEVTDAFGPYLDRYGHLCRSAD